MQRTDSAQKPQGRIDSHRQTLKPHVTTAFKSRTSATYCPCTHLKPLHTREDAHVRRLTHGSESQKICEMVHREPGSPKRHKREAR